MTLRLLVNPTSGKGKGAEYAQRAERVLSAADTVEVVTSQHGAHAETLAREAVASGCSGLVVVGGDGMVHLAVQALARTGLPLGIVPAGTGNDVARYLQLPRTDPEAAASRIVQGSTTTIDLARVALTDGGERYFVTVLAAGFDALVNERANQMRWPRGQMRYNLATLLELRRLRPLHYRAEFDGHQEEFAANLVAVGNGPSFGGGLRITEGADLHDGFLDVVVIEPLSRLELLKTYPKLFSGTHITHPNYRHRLARAVKLECADIIAYADGERLGATPLRITCAPDALRVFA